ERSGGSVGVTGVHHARRSSRRRWRLDRQQHCPGKSRREKIHPISNDWSVRARMAGAFLDAPQFPAGEWVVTVMRFCAAAQENGPTAKLSDMRRGERLPQIAFGLRFAVGTEILVVNRTIYFPHGRAGVFVQGDDELRVTAVEIHQQQIAEKN